MSLPDALLAMLNEPAGFEQQAEALLRDYREQIDQLVERADLASLQHLLQTHQQNSLQLQQELDKIRSVVSNIQKMDGYSQVKA